VYRFTTDGTAIIQVETAKQPLEPPLMYIYCSGVTTVLGVRWQEAMECAHPPIFGEGRTGRERKMLCHGMTNA